MIKRLSMAASVIGLTMALVGFLVLPAAGQDLHAPHVGSACAGEGQWHFVHNQVPAGSPTGVIEVVFSGSGTVTATADKVLSKVQHYNLSGAGAILSASDNIDGGKLVLSDYTCDEVTTTTKATTTTTKATTTTTTTKPTTTTTTKPPTTTTTRPHGYNT
jgi:hypothetical protein